LTGEIVDRLPSRRTSIRALRWTSEASAKVLGDVEVAEADLRGPASVRGTFRARSLRVNGSLDVGGELRVEERFDLSGVGRVDAAVAVGELAGDGTLEISGGFTARSAFGFRGFFTAPELRAPQLRFEGRLHVAKEIEGSRVQIRIDGPSSCSRIRAEGLEIRRGGPPWRRGELEVLRIDAKEAFLEGVRAEYVRTERVALGPDCHVTRVDGEIVRRHRTAHVGPESESPPPPGLTR
jgi:cytoskeletal protein CcmA (bactofilin family)